MTDPLSVTASVLAVTTAGVQAATSLYEAVKRFKDRNHALRRLQNELHDLLKILESLTQVADANSSILKLIQGPVERCSQECREFEQSMATFSQKPDMGFRDWAKMEFRRGNISEFIDNIAGYKATISVALGTITMQTSTVTLQVLEEYNEMVQDTVYNLEVQLQRIDEKMMQIIPENSHTSSIGIDLMGDREVTEQCLRICEEARSCIASITKRQSSLLLEPTQSTQRDDQRSYFEAQRLTRQALGESQDYFTETIAILQKRLQSLLTENHGDETEKLQFQEDINISRQCLEVCNVASEVSKRKVYRVGEVVAKGDSDQVVVTTLADLFDVGKALSQDNAAQLVGSMEADTLLQLAEKRYNSLFRASGRDPNPDTGRPSSSPPSVEARTSKSTIPQNNEQSPRSNLRDTMPTPNETRRRATPGAPE